MNTRNQKSPHTKRHGRNRAYCIVCQAFGTTAGLPQHITNQHPEFPQPQWQEIATDNWRLKHSASTAVTGIVFALNDYPDCPPWWWCIKNGEAIADSGTATNLKAAQTAAWMQWLRIAGENSKKSRSENSTAARQKTHQDN